MCCASKAFMSWVERPLILLTLLEGDCHSLNKKIIPFRRELKRNTSIFFSGRVFEWDREHHLHMYAYSVHYTSMLAHDIHICTFNTLYKHARTWYSHVYILHIIQACTHMIFTYVRLFYTYKHAHTWYSHMYIHHIIQIQACSRMLFTCVRLCSNEIFTYICNPNAFASLINVGTSL